MPKRAWQDVDPTRSDPADSDYDGSVHQSRGVRGSRTARALSKRKRPRQSYGDNGSEDISDSALDEEHSVDSGNNSIHEAEINEATGRPVRRAAKKHVYHEDDSDEGSIDFTNRIDSGGDKASPSKFRRGKETAQSQSQSLLVTLQLPKEGLSSPKRHRSLRGEVNFPHPPEPSRPMSATTRRSSRIAHDDKEPIIALTNSGHHAEVIRPGTRSPEAPLTKPARPTQGRKRPPSAIMEVESEISQQLKEEIAPHNSETEIDLEIAASREDLVVGDSMGDKTMHDTEPYGNSEETEGPGELAVDANDAAVVPESSPEAEDGIIKRTRRVTRQAGFGRNKVTANTPNFNMSTRPRRSGRAAQRDRGREGRKRALDDTSDFEPDAAKGTEEEISSSSASEGSPRKTSQHAEDSSAGNQRSRRNARNASIRRSVVSNEPESDEAGELAEELQELRSSRPRRRIPREDVVDDRPRTRVRKPVDYRILRPETNMILEDDGPPTATVPQRRRGGAAGGWQRSLHPTYGPFGGGGGPNPVFSGPGGIAATGGVDSDSSDDDLAPRNRTVGLGGLSDAANNPTLPGYGQGIPSQTHAADPLQTNFGRVKDKQALADADPLGVDPNVNFDGVGGLQGHIDQLKEMITLPLLYPEIFQRFHITPPRGVLFHGPPGTGKTLLARALANSVSSEGRQVTFYMRKGADALSKWVGEAEKQLRMLFEEARKTQPSIIFFDEIDGRNLLSRLADQ